MTFWCRRCAEQSRSNRCTAPPCASANTWISTWRGLRDEPLDVERAVAEGGPAPRGAPRRWPPRAPSSSADDAHALSAAAGGGLDEQREPGAPRGRRERRVGLIGRRFARHDRHARRAPSAAARRSSSPSRRWPSGGGPMKMSPASRQARRERRILGQEPVARVDGIGAGRRGRRRESARPTGSSRPAAQARSARARPAARTCGAPASASE